MSKPSARELDVKHMTAKQLGDHLLLRCGRELASRVEAVLAYCGEEQGTESRRFLARAVLRILNGEEP